MRIKELNKSEYTNLTSRPPMGVESNSARYLLINGEINYAKQEGTEGFNIDNSYWSNNDLVVEEYITDDFNNTWYVDYVFYTNSIRLFGYGNKINDSDDELRLIEID